MNRTVGPVLAAVGLFLFAQAAQADWTLAKRITWNSGGSGSRTLPLIPPTIFTWSGLMARPGTMRFITGRAPMEGDLDAGQKTHLDLERFWISGPCR